MGFGVGGLTWWIDTEGLSGRGLITCSEAIGKNSSLLD